MLVLFLAIFSAASALSTMEERLPSSTQSTISSTKKPVDLLTFNGSSEDDILDMLAKIMLPELTALTRGAASVTNLSHAQSSLQASESLARIFRMLKQNTTVPVFISVHTNVLCKDSLSDPDDIICSTNQVHSLVHSINNTKTR